MRRILYVEDNEINAMVVDFMLQDQYHIHLAHKPLEALQYIETYNYDLILMDIHLGDVEINGIELSHIIWERKPASPPPIIILTAYHLYARKEEFLKDGFSDLLIKPLGKELLLKSISQVLGNCGCQQLP
ncbi:MAG: response regulator [Bacteroidia bacterium]|nr:response regulator [Bacteroidia bacterium]